MAKLPNSPACQTPGSGNSIARAEPIEVRPSLFQQNEVHVSILHKISLLTNNILLPRIVLTSISTAYAQHVQIKIYSLVMAAKQAIDGFGRILAVSKLKNDTKTSKLRLARNYFNRDKFRVESEYD